MNTSLGSIASVFALVLSLALPCLTLSWIYGYLDGIASNRRLFNAHPLLMTIGLGLTFTHAVLSYRISQSINQSLHQSHHRNEPLLPTERQSFSQSINQQYESINHPITHSMAKGYHLLMHALTGLSIIAGFVIVYIYHANQSIDHFRSIHSWLGLLTMTLFTSNFLAGFLSFLYPKLSLARRRQLVPIHAWIGRSLIVCLMVTMVAGLMEKAVFESMKGDVSTGETILVNIIGLTVVLLGLSLLTVLSSRNQSIDQSNDQSNDDDDDDVSVERFDDDDDRINETMRLVPNNRAYRSFEDAMSAFIDETPASLMALETEEDEIPSAQFHSNNQSNNPNRAHGRGHNERKTAYAEDHIIASDPSRSRRATPDPPIIHPYISQSIRPSDNQSNRQQTMPVSDRSLSRDPHRRQQSDKFNPVQLSNKQSINQSFDLQFDQSLDRVTIGSGLSEGNECDHDSPISQSHNQTIKQSINQSNNQTSNSSRRSSRSMWPVFRGVGAEGILLGSPEN